MMWNLLIQKDTGRTITLLPIIIFLVYDLWYRVITEKKPVHYPDKWPRELILYLLLLYTGSIGLNGYGYLVSERHGMALVVAFFVMMRAHVEYLVLGIRRIYRTSKDFEKVVTFFDTLYASDRLQLPLKGILVIGY
jgi:hypothetical protein